MLTREEIGQALKGVTRRLVEAVGGQESAALIPGMRVKRHQAFSEYGNPEHDAWVPLDVLITLTLDSRSKVFIEWLARQIGHTVVRLPQVGTQASLNRQMGKAMKETAEVFEHLGAALEDGTLDRLEGKDIDTQIDEAIEQLLALRALADASVSERRGG